LNFLSDSEWGKKIPSDGNGCAVETAHQAVGETHSILRKRVVTRDRAAVRRQDEGNARVLFKILDRLFAKVNVQKIDAARKGRPVVFQSERLNPKRGVSPPRQAI